MNLAEAHNEGKETMLSLQNIGITKMEDSFDEIVSIMRKIKNCPIIHQFCILYNEKQQLPEIDYQYELHQKDKEIEKLKQQIKEIHSQTTIYFEPISEKPADFESDIFKACRYGKLTSVQWLIEKENVDKNKRLEKYDYYHHLYSNDAPIHIASKYGHLPIVQYLIEKQNVDKDIKGHWWKTPLHCACEYGHLPIAEYLISKGANINAKDESDNYIIHYACEKGLLSVVQHLIEKRNYDINIKGYKERSPLHYASEYGHLPIVEYLVSRGANINARDEIERTPLHYTAYDGQREIFKYLVSKGGNENAKDYLGYTPSALAFRKNTKIK